MFMVVTDFDGTLYTSDFNKNIRSLNNFRSKGNLVVIATGRDLLMLKKDLPKELEYDYIICTDGAVIYDKDLNVIYKKDISFDICREVSSRLQEVPYIDSVIYVDGYNWYESIYDSNSINGIITRYRDREKVKTYLDEIISDYPTIHGYISSRWVNITDISVSKANAIKILLSYVKMDDKNVITFGDEINDVEMIKDYNGYAIVKENNYLVNYTNKISNSIFEIIDELL